MIHVARALVANRWILEQVPDGGNLARNGQLLVLLTGHQEIRLRIFVYKVTGSSRGKADERRIEITSTYQKGLRKAYGFRDVVLGYHEKPAIFVGVDARRIKYGGPTGNAPSFFDREGLEWPQDNEILVRPRQVKLFPDGLEYHAFLKDKCLGDYLLNVERVHSGDCQGLRSQFLKAISRIRAVTSVTVPRGLAKGSMLVLRAPSVRTPVRMKRRLVRDYEQGNVHQLRRAKITQEQLQEIMRRCQHYGRLGEEFALQYERNRLRRLGKYALATKVKWVSRESACEGYDILSFEADGRKRLIEVKTTSGRGRVVEISANEWKVAEKFRSRYFIYNIRDILGRKPDVRIFGDPVDLERKGIIIKSPSGWLLKLS